MNLFHVREVRQVLGLSAVAPDGQMSDFGDPRSLASKMGNVRSQEDRTFAPPSGKDDS
jgi:hypothetical protein